ncbi:MAG: efflux RND transporter periplasmic adaptor subunit [Pseudomonadota bacterium]
MRALPGAVLGAACFGWLPAVAQEPSEDDTRPAVVVQAIETRTLVESESFIGRMEAIEEVDLRARVTGFLERVAFRDGEDVRAGDTLYEIERARYEADLAAAEADVARAQAEVEAARLALRRSETLTARDAVSEARLDEAQARFDAAEATLRQREATVRQAALDLSYTTITAPIGGRIGATRLTAGNLVEPTTAPLARIVQLDPIRARFFVADVDYVALQRQLDDDGEPLEERFEVHLRLPDDTVYEPAGTIDFYDTGIDPTTGTLAVRATFANPDRLLLPGQFVTVVVEIGEPRSVPVVPFAAVQQDREGRFVLVVDDAGKVEQRRIEIGTEDGSTYEVVDGLERGEDVVVQGVQRVEDGAEVRAVREPEA